MPRISAALRREVRNRAHQRCEYCRIPDEISSFGHQVDHIISIKQGGTSEPDNLAYACIRCNRYKGSDVAAYDVDSQKLTSFYNPRSQAWDEHFELKNGLMVGKTDVGRVTIRIFQMNHPKQVETRQNLIGKGLW